MEWAISPTPKSCSKTPKQKHNKQCFYWRVVIFTNKLQTSKSCVCFKSSWEQKLCTLKFEAYGRFQVESLSVMKYNWCALFSLILTRKSLRYEIEQAIRSYTHRKGNWGWWLEMCVDKVFTPDSGRVSAPPWYSASLTVLLAGLRCFLQLAIYLEN